MIKTHPTSHNTEAYLAQAQYLAKLRIAQRAQSDLYFLCREILGYKAMAIGTHSELCATTKGLLPSNKWLSKAIDDDSVAQDTLSDSPYKDRTSTPHRHPDEPPAEPHILFNQPPDAPQYFSADNNPYQDTSNPISQLNPTDPPTDIDTTYSVKQVPENPGLYKFYEDINGLFVKSEKGFHFKGNESQIPYDPEKKALHIEMPRGTFKSSVVTIGFTLQCILNDPDWRILIDSETYTKSKNFLSEIKDHLENNKKFRDIYLTIYGTYPDSNKKNSSVRWKDNELDLSCRTRGTKEASFTVSGVDKSINGMHFDLIVGDDLHSETNVTNREQIDKVIQHYKLMLALLDPNRYLIIIGTRWHFSDMYQYLFKEEEFRFNFYVRKARNNDGTLLFPERLDEKYLQDQRKSLGSYLFSCNPAGAPVMMADYTYKGVEDIQVGDEVMGFKKLGKRWVLTPTKVLATNHKRSLTQTVHMDDGDIIRCTPDHNWFTGRDDSTHKTYLPAHLHGRMLKASLYDPFIEENNQADWGYLAAMIDGEGAVKYGSIAISQSYEHHPGVCKRIEETLERLEIPYKRYETRPQQYSYVLNGGRDVKIRILNNCDLGKKADLVKNLAGYIARPVISRPKVVDIQPMGEETVYSFQTETGNYIIWNILSKNCQYLNTPVDDDDAMFRRDNIVTKSWESVEGIPINWYMSVDPSWEGKTSDYAAIVIAGFDAMANLYIRHVSRRKQTYGETITEIFRLYNLYKPKEIALETIASAKSIGYMLHQEMKRRSAWLPLKEITGRNTNKEVRIQALQPYYEYGRCIHVREMPQREELEDELTNFPKGEHDDMIDALATILEIAKPAKPSKDVDEREKDKAKIAKFTKPRSPLTRV